MRGRREEMVLGIPQYNKDIGMVREERSLGLGMEKGGKGRDGVQCFIFSQ